MGWFCTPQPEKLVGAIFLKSYLHPLKGVETKFWAIPMMSAKLEGLKVHIPNFDVPHLCLYDLYQKIV